MVFNEKLNSNYLAIYELTKEIGPITKNSFDNGNADLIPFNVEHILKITSDVTYRIISRIRELTV